MKRKTFIIEEYELKKRVYVQEMMQSIVKEGDINLLLRLRYYRVALTAELIDSIADTVKNVGKENEFVVDIVLETDQWNKVKRLRGKLNQYAIRVELKVSDQMSVKEVARYKRKLLLEKLAVLCKDYQSFQISYDKWKVLELSIGLEGYELTVEEYFDFFEKWIHDPKATWFVPFEDIIYSMLTGVPSGDCRHSSCMGKYLYLDQSDNVYFCAKKRKSTQMYSITEYTPNLHYNDRYNRILQTAIEKRNHCVEKCELFRLCRGGCPLEEKTQENCTEFVQKVSRIGEFIEKEIGSSFADIENPCMRQLYLSLIAYGFGVSQ